MNAEMNEIERNGNRRTDRSLVIAHRRALNPSSNVIWAMTFEPISTAC